jgi:hypothetical protein
MKRRSPHLKATKGTRVVLLMLLAVLSMLVIRQISGIQALEKLSSIVRTAPLLRSISSFTKFSTMASRPISVDFEVFGVVQGVFFRAYTQRKAQSLGLVGWVKNTNQGSVKGVIQGTQDKIDAMKVGYD